MDLRNDHSRQYVFSNAITVDYENMMSDIISAIEHWESPQ
jgi:hypothetical protein